MQVYETVEKHFTVIFREIFAKHNTIINFDMVFETFMQSFVINYHNISGLYFRNAYVNDTRTIRFVKYFPNKA